MSESKGTLFVRIIAEGTPARGSEEEAENSLKLTCHYTDTDGAPIDPTKLEQGTEFIATVSCTESGLTRSLQEHGTQSYFPFWLGDQQS